MLNKQNISNLIKKIMPTITQDNTATLQHVKGSSVPANWRKQFGIKPNHILTITLKVEKKGAKKPYITEEIKAWEDSLPTIELSDKESASIEEAIKEKGIRMTVEEAMATITS
jgi:bifunctional DNA-binding transcriptional regulator/antitoxin component of YhaV-PrlF toxin-antitoxin module